MATRPGEDFRSEVRLREEQLRQLLLRGLTSASILVASLMLYRVVPLLPLEISVLIALGLGILAFKFTLLATLLMFVPVVPAYIYQLGPPPPGHLGLPTSVFMAMALTLVIVAAGTRQAGAALGIATGTIAAMLMFTPIHFLALPLMIATPLFRARGRQVGSVGAIVVFLALYFPVLMSQQNAPETTAQVSLLQPLKLDAKAPLPPIDISNIMTRLREAVPALGSESEQRYYLNLANYWPITVHGRVIPIGILVAGLLLLSIASAFGVLTLFRWIQTREFRGQYLPFVAPIAATLAGGVIFLTPLAMLTDPLAYTITISIPGLLLGTLAVGGAGSLVEFELSRRDLIVRLRESLNRLIPSIESRMASLMARVREVRAIAHGIDLLAEEGLAQRCELELSFAEGAVSEMNIKDLRAKVALFGELQQKLAEALPESHRKLCQHYDEERQGYNEYLRISAEYGFRLGEQVGGLPLAELALQDYSVAVEAQRSLNYMYEIAAQSLLGALGELELTLRSEVDPEFKRIGIEIARNYISQSQYGEALDTLLAELADIDHLVGAMAEGLDTQIAAAARSLEAVLRQTLIPALDTIGDLASVAHYSGLLANLDSIARFPPGKRRLPDLMDMLRKTRELEDLVSSVVSRLVEKIARLEGDIDRQVPRGYNWGKSADLDSRIEVLRNSYLRPAGLLNATARMSRASSALKPIEDATSVIKQYTSAHEFLINFANIEYLVEEKLREAGAVVDADVPVRPLYAQQYLKLYAEKHPSQVVFEAGTGKLRARNHQ